MRWTLRKHGNAPQKTHHKTPNAHVVGLSRATNPKHLKILDGFDESLMQRSRLADNEVDRLRSDTNCHIKLAAPDLEQMCGTKIVYYNVQGLLEKTKIKKNS